VRCCFGDHMFSRFDTIHDAIHVPDVLTDKRRQRYGASRASRGKKTSVQTRRHLLLNGYASVGVGDKGQAGVVFLQVAQWTGVQSQQIGGVLE